MSPQMLNIWGGGQHRGLRTATQNQEYGGKKEASTTHQVNRNKGRGRREAAGGGQQGAERVRTVGTQQRRKLPELHKGLSVMGRSPGAQEGTSGLWFPDLKCLFKCEKRNENRRPSCPGPAGMMQSPVAWVSWLQGGRAPALPLTPLLTFLWTGRRSRVRGASLRIARTLHGPTPQGDGDGSGQCPLRPIFSLPGGGRLCGLCKTKPSSNTQHDNVPRIGA